MAPVSVRAHLLGMQPHRYLDDWLIMAPSKDRALEGIQSRLDLCSHLGLLVNWEDLSLDPSQRITDLGMHLTLSRT